MKFKDGMKTKHKIEALQRQILVHSMLYYEMNESVISDKKYDKLSQLLVNKMNEVGPEKVAKTQYGYVFYDFDGSTGFDLISRLTEADRIRVEQVATAVLCCYRREVKK